MLENIFYSTLAEPNEASCTTDN